METSLESDPIETINETMNDPKNTNKFSLELGDIIEIISPTNPVLHQSTYLINYIDNNVLKIIHVSTGEFIQLNITSTGRITDESITHINLLDRAEENGYARQNNLLPKQWIDIHFGGEIPSIITGEITNLEEDMIEITTYPELHTLYINFKYQGIPSHIPIEKIKHRNKPESLSGITSLANVKETLDNNEDIELSELSEFKEDEYARMEYTDENESIITIPENGAADENIKDTLRDLYLDINDISYGKKLEGAKYLVEIPENERQYGIDEQITDMTDELLSTIPNNKRTKQVLDNIHLLAERYKQLRHMFSNFDDNQNVYSALIKGANYKPLIENICKMNTKLRWLIPVVTNNKLLYTSEGPPIDDISQTETAYKENQSTYLNYTQTILEELSSFNDSDNKELYLDTVSVKTNLDAVVENLDNFYSAVTYNDSEKRKKYLIQRYNMGETTLDKINMKSGKTVYLRKNITSDDEMTIKSFLIMPEPVIRYSLIDLPGTNILKRANLHHENMSLFRILREQMVTNPHIIDDLSKEIDYGNMNDENKGIFLNGIHQFLLNKELNEEQIGDDTLRKFLEVIIPKTRFFVKLIRKYVKEQVSFVDIVKQLEPFLIYSTDVTYKQYDEIRYFIKQRITEIKQDYSKNEQSYSRLRNAKYDTNLKESSLIHILTNNSDMNDMFTQNYNLERGEKNRPIHSSQEVLNNLYTVDSACLYTNMIKTMMISLVTPENLDRALEPPNIDELTDNEKMKPGDDCVRRFLTKKYSSMKELQKDNSGDELYYDIEFDDTPYDMLNKYDTQRKEMTPDLFLEFLTENLTMKHNIEKEQSNELAQTLIEGKKRVRSGEYAILEIKPTLGDDIDSNNLSDIETRKVEAESNERKRIKYYRRVKTNWIEDKEIDPEAFFDTNTLFCNISETCYKNMKTNICETVDTRRQSLSNNKLMNEFDMRYEISATELAEKLNTNLQYYRKQLQKSKILREINLYRANNLAYALGGTSNAEELITSPNLKLRELILGQSDFVKKQNDIVIFVDKFCRAPMIEELKESAHWFYCKETNTQLFPKSIYELANAFTLGHNYLDKLEQLCQDVGIISDNGDATVDRHTGYTLRKIEFDTDEGFDNLGYHVSTRDVMEKELGNVILENIGRKEKRIFENETSEMIYNVFSAIATYTDINVDGGEEFIIRTTTEHIDKDIMNESKYNKRSNKQQKDGKKPLQPYKDYRNETIIFIVASVLHVYIQTVVPSIKTTKGFPGCVRSFSGFPMEGIEDITGIEYIACIINKIKSSITPWNSLKKYKVETIKSRIKDIISNNILPRNDVTDMYTKKRDYILLNPDTVTPEEHNITKWKRFLPPVVPYSVAKNLRTVSNDFKNELSHMMKEGNIKQYNMIHALMNKTSLYGYSIIEHINNIVKEKDTLLKTSGDVPFLENACCNDNNIVRPIEYFNNENEEIGMNIRITRQLGSIAKHIHSLSKAPMLYDPEITGMSYPVMNSGNMEEVIYSTIFYYCNFDTNLPVPEKYQSICSERPTEYNPEWTMQDKIEFMKKNGKIYNETHLQQLMDLVQKRNIIEITENTNFKQVGVLKEILNKMEQTNDTVFSEPFRRHLLNLLNTYNPKRMTHEISPELQTMKRYLTNVNKKMKDSVSNFLNQHGNISNNEISKMIVFLNTLTTIPSINGNADSVDMYSQFQTLKTYIHNMSSLYPSALSSSGPTFHNMRLESWGLSKQHYADIDTILETYYMSIGHFQNDKVIIKLLKELSNRLKDMDAFIQHIPVHSEIVKKINDTDESFHSILDTQTTCSIFEYCYLSVLNEYIDLSMDDGLLHADIQERKMKRREQIATENDDSLQSMRQDEDVAEIQIDLGHQEELQQRIAKLLITYLNMGMTHSNTTNLSYDDIMKNINRSKEKEKQRMMKYLGDMNIQDRNIEDTLKHHKIGRWNVGLQKSMYMYDKSAYDRERSEMIQNGTIYETDLLGEQLPQQPANKDVFEDEDNEMNPGEDTGTNRDTYDFTELENGYDDGDFYPEDRDDDDFEMD